MSNDNGNEHPNVDDLTDRQPLKLKFSLSSIMGFSKKDKQETAADVAIHNDDGGDDDDDDDDDDNENSVTPTPPPSFQDQGSSSHSSKQIHHHLPDADDAASEEEEEEDKDPMRKYSNSTNVIEGNYKNVIEGEYAAFNSFPMMNYNKLDQYSQSEESNLNENMKKDDEGMDESSLADDKDIGSQEEDEKISFHAGHNDVDKDSQEGGEASNTRKTRSASIDDRDGSQSGTSTGNGIGIGTNNSTGTGNYGLKETSMMPRDTKDASSHDGLMENKTSRSAAAAERELLGFREPATATVPTTSFLDSLSEDQRRVRTRHLPDVAGFRRLHKAEIKRDLALVKKMLKAASKNGKKASSLDEDGMKDAEMEKVDVEATGASEDESQSDVDSQNHNVVPKSKPGKGQFSDAEFANVLVNPSLPSTFSMPYNESPYICTDVEGKAGDASAQPSLFSSPQVVESITAFNPPIPPESFGPKKMHRLNRWERNPQDVEVDLSNYRKTVERTRQELHKAEDERKRIGDVGQHLRAHFLTHLQCMSHEINLLDDDYEETQGQCIEAADVLSAKAPSRGAAKGSDAIKDVFSVMKSRGEGASLDFVHGQSSVVKSACSLGVGGISEDSTSGLASGWLLPGDKVATAYGDGSVAHAFGPTALDATLPPQLYTKNYSSKDAIATTEEVNSRDENPNVSVILPPRICVKLPFGMGYFSSKNITMLENSSHLSDEQLAKRWLAMIECSKGTGTSVDFAGVDNADNKDSAIVSPASSVGNRDNEDDIMGSVEVPTSTARLDASMGNDKLLPYGSSLLPSATIRGGGLEVMSIEQLEKNVSEMLEKSGGVIGARDHPSVPPAYKQWEFDREELRTLQGKAQQLRNAVYRQRRIRFMNEKNAATSQNRRDRFEVLLAEMKSDLDILKERLKEELNDLGVDQSQARQMLSKYYKVENDEIVSSEKRKADDDDDYEKSSRLKTSVQEGTPLEQHTL